MVAEEERAARQAAASDIQGHLLDLTAVSLDDLGSVGSEVLSRAIRRVMASRQGADEPFAAFQSSI